jgi:HTH-type transcriptional regulator/antitoxin HigA
MTNGRIRAIGSAADYEAALARAEALMDMERTEAEDDEFDHLVTLIELYEDDHFPMDPPADPTITPPAAGSTS